MDESHDLTQSLEDYLETIYELTEEVGGARGSSVADKLHVKRPSVTSALRSLAEKGLVNYSPYGPVTLTEKGEVEAKKVIRRHKAMEIFLERILGVDGTESKDAACRLEHAMNDEITTRLVEFVEFVDSCPRVGASLFRRSDYHCREKNNDQYCAMCIHGCLDEIVHSGRTVDLSSVHRESQPLSSLSGDRETLIFVQLAEELQDRPEYPSTYWRPNKTLRLLKTDKEGTDEMFHVEIDGRLFVINLEDAKKMEVIPC